MSVCVRECVRVCVYVCVVVLYMYKLDGISVVLFAIVYCFDGVH